MATSDLNIYGEGLMERFNEFLSQEGLMKKLDDFFIEGGFERPKTILDYNGVGEHDGTRVVTIKITATVNPSAHTNYVD